MNPTARLIIDSIPSRFRPEKARGLALVFHFDIAGAAGNELQATVVIKDGACTLQNGLHGNADCILTAGTEAYVALETGTLDPQTAFMEGRVKVSNIPAMMQFAKCFRKFEASNEPLNSIRIPNSEFQIQRTGPLSGVKILDFTRLLPGPLATMFLADLGAEVIKIEDPDSPDYIRGFEPRIKGQSMYYLALNRNKRSLAVNYLSAEGKQLIYDLVKTADVLVEQFRPGVMKEWGFDYATLLRHNPKLIYVAITGYGQNSSLAAAAGHDLNYIAKGGALGITHNEDGEPVIPGFQLGDIAGGSYMAMNAVTAALYQREKTGQGDFVDVAMTDAVLPFVSLQFARYQADNNFAANGKFELSGSLANYNVYRCADGKFVALGSLEPKFWRGFCLKAGKPEWADGFLWKGEQLETLRHEVQTFFLAKPAAYWLEEFKNEDICLNQINGLGDLAGDAYLNERQMFIEHIDESIGSYKTISQPLKFATTGPGLNRNAPDLGQDTLAILSELGYTENAIADLRKINIIKL